MIYLLFVLNVYSFKTAEVDYDIFLINIFKLKYLFNTNKIKEMETSRFNTKLIFQLSVKFNITQAYKWHDGVAIPWTITGSTET